MQAAKCRDSEAESQVRFPRFLLLLGGNECPWRGSWRSRAARGCSQRESAPSSARSRTWTASTRPPADPTALESLSLQAVDRQERGLVNVTANVFVDASYEGDLMASKLLKDH